MRTAVRIETVVTALCTVNSLCEDSQNYYHPWMTHSLTSLKWALDLGHNLPLKEEKYITEYLFGIQTVLNIFLCTTCPWIIAYIKKDSYE